MNLKTSCPIILVYCKSKPYEIKNKLPYINRKRTIGFLFLSRQAFCYHRQPQAAFDVPDGKSYLFCSKPCCPDE